MLRKITAVAFLALLANTAYIGAFAEPTIFYMGNVLLHVALGVVVYLLSIRTLPRLQQIIALAVFATGAFLTWKGAVLRENIREGFRRHAQVPGPRLAHA